MLLNRSVLSKVCLLLAICLVKAQYEYDQEEKKEVNEEEEDERDYAKIFAQETSPSLATAKDDPDNAEESDYVTPVEFENYFTPAHIFGESNKKPVRAEPEKKKKEPLQTFESKKEDFHSFFDDGPFKKFFEESEKKQQQKLEKQQSKQDEEIIPPGPSYISHQIPAHYSDEDDEDDKSTSATEDVERVPGKKNKHVSTGAVFEEGKVEKNEDDYQLPPFNVEAYKVSKPKVDYNTGKSSSSVSQYPSASGYTKPTTSASYKKFNSRPSEEDEEKKPSASSPYEDFSSQTSEDYEKKVSETSPYEKYSGASDYEKKASASSPYKKYNYQPSVSESETESEAESESQEYEPKKPAANTPYQKYSFQPSEDYEAKNSKFFDSIISTVAPFNPNYKKNTEPKYETQSSEAAPQQEGKGCRKVSSKSDDMNCFVCENPKTNAKYTQCSYSSQQKPVNYYEGNSAKYSMPHKEEPSSYRYKRYADSDENDPYTYIRNRARKASHESSGIPSDYSSGFNYEAEHYDESKPDITYSEQHSEEIKKNPENCKKVDKEGMTCTVCKDPKTGGNFEQCSYTSKPQEKKYAYVTEKKFDNDEPVETKVVSQTAEAETSDKQKGDASSKPNTELYEEYESRVKQDKAPKKRNEEGHKDHDAKSSEKKTVDDDSYDFATPFTFSSPSFEDSYKGSSSDRSENVDNKKSDFSDFDEYHFKYFPEFAKQESRQEPVQESYNVPIPEASKQNVETVLAEFSKKDRSNCKKAEKKGMTCYLCVDKNNIQHEECMYVQESKPENTHVAYHEVKATEKAKVPEAEKSKTQESKKEEVKQEPAVTETKNKYLIKKVPGPAPLLGLVAAASEQVGTFVRYNPERENLKRKRSSGSAKEKNAENESDKETERELKPDESAYESERLDDKDEPTIKTPEEFNVAPGEGAFSDETKAVYSKELGIQLPKYMLEKSEFEKEFDAFSGSF